MRLLISTSSKKIPKLTRKKFEALSPADKKRYLTAFPNSSFGKKPKAVRVNGKHKTSTKKATNTKDESAKLKQYIKLARQAVKDAKQAVKDAKQVLKDEIAEAKSNVLEYKADLAKAKSAADKADIKEDLEEAQYDLKEMRTEGGDNKHRRRYESALDDLEEAKEELEDLI